MLDVIVVGGGPAGSMTARSLALGGLDVLLVERAQFPRRKVCGEYLNGGAVAALDRFGVLDAVREHAMPLRGTRIVPPHAPPVELAFPAPALACARETLDRILLDHAIAAGVTVVRGRVDGLTGDEARFTGVRMRGAGGTMQAVGARWIVGADGCGSVVARSAGLATAPSRGARFAVGGHYAGFGDLDGYVEMYVGTGAYFALNPLARDRTNVMVVVPRRNLERWSRDVDDGVTGTAARLGRGIRSFADAHRIGDRVAIGPLAHRVRRPIAEGVILAGDAAGFLNPFTGQGVALALAGAEAAGAAIRVAAASTARERRAFHDYAAAREEELRLRQRLSAAVRTIIDIGPLARSAVARLRRSPETALLLMDALSGLGSPKRALAPAALVRLIV